MSQTIQYDKNPAAEGAAVRVSRASATPSIATDAFTSWPPQGTKSHKLVATATTVATVGLPNADRPAAAAGQQWSARATIRNSAAAARDILLAVVFYDTVGATLGTATGTVSAGGSTPANSIVQRSIDGATAPAGTASIDVQVVRSAGSGAAVSDAVHFDQVTLTRTAAAVAYKDPAADGMSVWSGTANASTQTYYTPVINLTGVLTADPAPRVVVTIDDLPATVATLTLYRQAEGRSIKVRGAVDQLVTGGFSVQDVEAPFHVESSYRAQMFTTAGLDLGFTTTSAITLLGVECWVHNPLDPAGAISIDLSTESGMVLSRPIDGEMFYPEGRTLGVLISGRRRGLRDVNLYFSTDDLTSAAKFEAMFGGYGEDDQLIPILCLRTPGYIDLPRTFYAAALEPKRMPVTVHMGGQLRNWDVKANEVTPPAPGIIVALLTRNDIDAFFATRNLLDAAYPNRLAIDRDYAKAGTA